MSVGPPPVDMSYIGLLFQGPIEDRIALRWANRLATLLGAEARQLRPETTLSQLLDWAAVLGADSMDFVVVFEPELAMDFLGFLDYANHVNFRDLVEHYAKRIQQLGEPVNKTIDDRK